MTPNQLDHASEEKTQDMSRRGEITWISSDGEGPDCGIAVGLGNDRFLYCGEISRDLWEEIGKPFGDDFGWWLILYQNPPANSSHRIIRGQTVIARFVSKVEARDFADILVGLFMPPEAAS